MRHIPLTPLPYRYRTSVVLDDLEVTLRLVWSDRAGAWYLSVDGPTGPVVASQRVTPGSPALPRAPVPQLGRLVVVGPDPYQREDLGRSVRLYYLEPGDDEAGVTP